MDAKKTWKVLLSVGLYASVEVEAEDEEAAAEAAVDLWNDDAQFVDEFLQRSYVSLVEASDVEPSDGRADIAPAGAGETRN